MHSERFVPYLVAVQALLVYFRISFELLGLRSARSRFAPTRMSEPLRISYAQLTSRSKVSASAGIFFSSLPALFDLSLHFY
jgi:hypothetical protein